MKHEPPTTGALDAKSLDAERGRADLLQRTELRILSLVAAGAPLAEVLTALVLGIEEQGAEMIGSVLLFDRKEGVLRHGAAPHLPEEYNAIVDGHEIGPLAGSCGTAAHLRERVIVADIATDPRWAAYKEIAARFNLAACWSEPILDQAGDVVGTFGMYYRTRRAPSAWDIGLIEIAAKLASIAVAQSRAEAALRASEERLRGALAAARMGTWEWNIATGEVIWSDGVEALLGLAKGSFAGTYEAYSRISLDEDKERVARAIEDALAGRKPEYAVEHRVRLEDGSVRWLEGKGTVYRDARGAAVRMAGTVADITARKETEAALRASEAQLRQSQKMDAVGRLAGGIAHDFNNILTIIGASSRLALKQAPPGGRLHLYLSEIAAAGDRAADLTRRLLAFSRQQILTLRVIDLTNVVEGVARLLQRVVAEDVELQTVLASGLGMIRADPGQIEQVVMNLAVNARDAMPHGGRLTIETALASQGELPSGIPAAPLGYVVLAVHDTGHGMDGQTQSHVFEPFFTTKDPGKGTGLGLSTVYGIVKQLQGHVTFRSEVGKGTTFTVYFPRADVGAVERPEARRHSAAPGVPVRPAVQESVLLVEDEGSVRTLAREALEAQGYRVLVAANGREAWDLHCGCAGPIHILVTDVVMPEMGGRELVDRLCPLRPEMQVLFISGHADDALVQRGIDNYGAKFLQKPFAMETLVRRVAELLTPPAA